MRRWYVRCPQDDTFYCGTTAEGHEWSLDYRHGPGWPTHLQATLAMMAMERAYGGVGYYSAEVVGPLDE